jgi:PAS domain S-box-containing protein
LDIQAVEKAKQHWQTAADLMPQLICLMDEAGRLLRVNRTMEWWGLGDVVSARGRDLHAILHPGCVAPECYFTRFWQDATLARLEGRRSEIEAFDAVLNRYLAILVQPLVLRQHDQEFAAEDLHTIVIVDDVSDLKEAEAAIRRRTEELANQVANESKRRVLSEEMQARLLTILEQTTDYVAMADVSESLLYLNPAGRSMLGLGPSDDVSGKSLCDHADPDVRDALRQIAVPTAVEKGLWAGESRMRDSKGREIHASQVIIAHRGANGQVDCISTILRDITERVKNEQALRESREELRQLSGMLVSIQEDERRRIALDLHDGLGQSLSLIKLAVENAAEQVAEGEYATAHDTLRQLVPRLKDALVDVRRVSTELRPSILDDLGILPTLSWFFREFEAVCDRIVVEKVLTVREQDVPSSLKITLYRVLQEATSNIIKHAAADRIRVRLYRDADSLHLSIEDNGRGFDPVKLCAPCDGCRAETCRGIGLVSMKERVTLTGGQYRLTTSPGAGTRVEASWPLGQRSR